MFVKKRKREFGVLYQIKFQGWHFLDLSGAGAPSPSGFSSSFFEQTSVALGSGLLMVSRQLGPWISRNLTITQDLHL